MSEKQAMHSAAGNRILPNTFQHPNIFIDRLMYYLTPEENVVLTFAIRRILGFQDNISSRKDNISLSQFTDGITSQDGRPLSNGCGLGTAAVRRALEALSRYKILMPTQKADPRKGQEYWLQENELAIDWDALEERIAQKKDREARRTSRARCVVGQQGAVGQQARGYVPQQARVLSDNNTKPTETHANPKETPPAPPRSDDAIVEKLATGEFEGLTPAVLNGWFADWPGQDHVILRAIDEAMTHGAHHAAYITKTLATWKKHGIPPLERPRGNKQSSSVAALHAGLEAFVARHAAEVPNG